MPSHLRATDLFSDRPSKPVRPQKPESKTALDILLALCADAATLGEENGSTSDCSAHLVAVLSDLIVRDIPQIELAISALEPFTWGSTLHRNVVCRQGAVPPLIAMVRGRNARLQSAALRILSHLADGDSERHRILAREQCISPLLQLLRDAEGLEPEVAFMCSRTLTALAVGDEADAGCEKTRRVQSTQAICAAQICAAHGIEIAVECLRSADPLLSANMAHMLQALFPLDGERLAETSVGTDERLRLRQLADALKSAGPPPEIVPEMQSNDGLPATMGNGGLVLHLQRLATAMMEAAAHEATDRALLEDACCIATWAKLPETVAEGARARFEERASAPTRTRKDGQLHLSCPPPSIPSIASEPRSSGHSERCTERSSGHEVKSSPGDKGTRSLFGSMSFSPVTLSSQLSSRRLRHRQLIPASPPQVQSI